VKTALLALACCLLVLALPQAARADAFKVYPGAILDQKLTADAQRAQHGKGFAVRVYRTTDSFDKVRAFYAPLYHDAHVSGRYASGPAAKVKLAMFTVDAAKQAYLSKYWFRITRPFFTARLPDGTTDFRSARDETAIMVVQTP
jgi:hypothetical protein